MFNSWYDDFLCESQCDEYGYNWGGYHAGYNAVLSSFGFDSDDDYYNDEDAGYIPHENESQLPD